MKIKLNCSENNQMTSQEKAQIFFFFLTPPTHPRTEDCFSPKRKMKQFCPSQFCKNGYMRKAEKHYSQENIISAIIKENQVFSQSRLNQGNVKVYLWFWILAGTSEPWLCGIVLYFPFQKVLFFDIYLNMGVKFVYGNSQWHLVTIFLSNHPK